METTSNHDAPDEQPTGDSPDELQAKRERAERAQQAALPNDPKGTTYDLQDDGSVLTTLPSGTKQRRAPVSATFLSKADIVKADDSGYEDVHVPEWGGWVRVKRLTARERGEIEAQQVKIGSDGEAKYDGSHMREQFAQMALVDPTTGTRLFSAKEISLLGNKSAAALDRVYEAATRQARMSKADMQELQGNSGSGLSGISHGGTAKG